MAFNGDHFELDGCTIDRVSLGKRAQYVVRRLKRHLEAFGEDIPDGYISLVVWDAQDQLASRFVRQYLTDPENLSSTIVVHGEMFSPGRRMSAMGR